MSGRLLRACDVAAMLDVSTETILRWHRSGRLPGGRRLASNVLRFDSGEIDEWLAGTRTERPLVPVLTWEYPR